VRGSAVAVIAVVCAVLGGAAALVIGESAGWLGGGTDTVVIRADGSATPVSQVETGAGGAQPLPGNAFDPAAIYKARAGGVVTVFSIFTGGQEGLGQGSGFVVSDDGTILTNSHVITTAGEGPSSVPPKPAEKIYIEFRDGDRVTATIVGWDLYDDVGVLKIDPKEHELRPLPLGDSSKVVVGEPVAAIGSPFGQTSTITAGIVGATERAIDSLTSDFNLLDAIQTDAPINRGNSGGPLFNARGLVIGINAQIQTDSGNAEGVGFAVPINSAVRSMDQLVASGAVHYAWVGVRTQTVTPALADHLHLGADRGAAVQSIEKSSPGEKAGLKAGSTEREFGGVQIRVGGDIIVAIDGKPVATSEDVVRAVTARLPGETIRVTVVRDSKRLDVKIRLGERPANPSLG
jgi:S1-C subfamily serine protease